MAGDVAADVHLLIVHGVGDHDHLANLLRTYQSFRANLQSTDVPVTAEDALKGWNISTFDERSSPPRLILTPDVPTPGTPASVLVYELNYSQLAGVIRRNHRIDLTALFLGLDAAVALARQQKRSSTSVQFGEGTADVGRRLQSVTSVLAAGTVPILGLPSLLFKRYVGTIVGLFTRFFDDVATFALDKNGERLISAHMDRSIETIRGSMKEGDRFVIAAHSLGSIVTHNHIVRRWSTGPVPDTVITFGSPIGLLVWGWLFLDFDDMQFKHHLGGDSYFCWKPVYQGTGPRKRLRWFNAVNCGDPIATSFPAAAVDLSAKSPALEQALDGGIQHRYFGKGRLTDVGVSHTSYLDDRHGFVPLLLRAVGLAGGRPEDVASTRTADEHWRVTDGRLRVWQMALWGLAALLATGYGALYWSRVGDLSLMWTSAVYFWPPLTIGALAFFQRLLFGGPTKRIPVDLLQRLRWWSQTSFPYRLRELIVRGLGRSRDVDPRTATRGGLERAVRIAVAFLPVLALMSLPAVFRGVIKGVWQPWADLAALATTRGGVMALALFVAYVAVSALHTLCRGWRHLLVASGARPATSRPWFARPRRVDK